MSIASSMGLEEGVPETRCICTVRARFDPKEFDAYAISRIAEPLVKAREDDGAITYKFVENFFAKHEAQDGENLQVSCRYDDLVVEKDVVC